VPWQVLIAGGDDWKHAAPLRAHDTATIQCDLDAYVRKIRRCLKHLAAVIGRFTQPGHTVRVRSSCEGCCLTCFVLRQRHAAVRFNMRTCCYLVQRRSPQKRTACDNNRYLSEEISALEKLIRTVSYRTAAVVDEPIPVADRNRAVAGQLWMGRYEGPLHFELIRRI
jgi:hypothetical protein